MLIFIDESGSFVVPSRGGRSVCCVAALVVPESNYLKIVREFEILKAEWGEEGSEVKGRDLGEREIAGLITLLNKFDVLLEVVVIDMGLHTCAGIAAHKARQVERIMDNITSSRRRELIDSLKLLQSRIAALPDQLYTQATLMTVLVQKLLQNMTLYYAQRQPQELGCFKWHIDAKDNGKLTEYEMLWRSTVMPYLEGNLAPLVRLRGADYSSFYKFTGTSKQPPRHLRNKFTSRPFDYIRIDKLMKDMRFAQSQDEAGLQLVDILCNACRRALNGNLDPQGWERLGSLMVEAQKGHQEIEIVDLCNRAGMSAYRGLPYAEVIIAIQSLTKAMLVLPSRNSRRWKFYGRDGWKLRNELCRT
jgi:hypothetical protein